MEPLINLPQAFMERDDSVYLLKMFTEINEETVDIVKVISKVYEKRFVLCTQLYKYILIYGYSNIEGVKKYINKISKDETINFIFDTKLDYYINKENKK